MSSQAKIRVKVGSMEIEYEGDPSFLDGGIETLLETMGNLAPRVPKEAEAQTGDVKSEGTSSANGSFSFSTNTIAAHLGSKTGPELVICAIAHLELVKGKTSSTRIEILDEMKSATSYYNTNMRSNMTKNLEQITKAKRVNLIAKDTYSLSATERKEIEGKVADIG